MRPSRSARKMFSIFIASTTASGSPVLTSWPWLTVTEESRPGIGDNSRREVSEACFSGISASSSAARGDNTCARRITPPCVNQNPAPPQPPTCTLPPAHSDLQQRLSRPPIGRCEAVLPLDLDTVCAFLRSQRDGVGPPVEQYHRALGNLGVGPG